MFDSNGEIGDPCGLPLSLVFVAGRSLLPSTLVACFHRCFQPHLDQAEYPPVADPSRYRCHELRVGDRVEVTAQVCVNHFRETRRGAAIRHALRRLSPRSRRYAYCSGSRSASKIGPKTRTAAICTTRSRIQGIPSGRVLPGWPSLGMFTLRTGWVRYVCWRSSSANSSSHLSSPYPSIHLNVTSSTPATPRLARQRSKASLKDVLAVKFVVEGVESVVGQPRFALVCYNAAWSFSTFGGGTRLMSISRLSASSCVNL